MSSKRIATRTALGLFTILGLYVGYRALENFLKDPDTGVANTIGAIAAVELLPDGAHAVYFTADGKRVDSPDYKAGSTDKDLAWRPDGNRIFFVGDREDGVFQIIRWNVAKKTTEVRSVGERSKARITFGPPGYPDQLTALVSVGGFVQDYNPRTGELKQVLPPIGNTAAQNEEGGGVGSFEAVYRDLGTSFKEAKWGKDREMVIATLRRDDGEVLIIQKLARVEGPAGSSLAAPIPVAAGDRIEFDVDRNGRVAYSIQGFKFLDPRNVPEEFIQGDRVVPPFRNALGLLDPTQESPQQVLIGASPEDIQGFGHPRFTPDGADLIVLLGAVDEAGDFRSQFLARIPAEEAGVQRGVPIFEGAVREFDISPDGQRLALTLDRDGKRPLFTINLDGSNLKPVDESRNYSEPRFSPQQAAKP